MKHRALDCAATINSIMSVLNLMCTPTRSQAACENRGEEAMGLLWVLAGLSKSCLLLTVLPYMITTEILLPPRFPAFQTAHRIVGSLPLLPPLQIILPSLSFSG